MQSECPCAFQPSIPVAVGLVSLENFDRCNGLPSIVLTLTLSGLGFFLITSVRPLSLPVPSQSGQVLLGVVNTVELFDSQLGQLKPNSFVVSICLPVPLQALQSIFSSVAVLSLLKTLPFSQCGHLGASSRSR